jgi:hypothetical protein
MGMVYRAVRPVGLDEGQVQAAGKAIEAIRKKYGGVCPPAEYVERARPEKSPTHDHFDWDADAALERELLNRAREIVRVVVLTDAGSAEEDAPKYINVSVTTLDHEEIIRGNASPEAVMARPDWASQAERDLLKDIRGRCEGVGYLPVARRILEFLDGLEQEQGVAPAA